MSARELLVLAIMCLVWGFHFVVIKLAVEAIQPIFYAAIRMTLVAAIMSPFLKWRRGEMAPVLTAGLCLGALNYAFMFSGVKLGTASSAAIALELYVPFATILSIFFLGERIGLPRVMGIACAFAGVAIIATGKPSDVSQEAQIGLGVMLVACGAFTEAIGAILVKKATGFQPHQLLAWFSLVGTIGLWVFTAIFETGQQAAFAASDKWLIAVAILYSAIGASVFGHSAYYWLLQRLPISVVAPSVLLTTMIAVFFGVLLLGDPFGPRVMVGAVLVLSGVGIVIFRNSRKKATTQPLTDSEVAP